MVLSCLGGQYRRATCRLRRAHHLPMVPPTQGCAAAGRTCTDADGKPTRPRRGSRLPRVGQLAERACHWPRGGGKPTADKRRVSRYGPPQPDAPANSHRPPTRSRPGSRLGLDRGGFSAARSARATRVTRPESHGVVGLGDTTLGCRHSGPLLRRPDAASMTNLLVGDSGP